MTRRERRVRCVDGLYADTPCLVAARTVLSQQLGTVRRQLEAVTKASAHDRERVRQLRVAIRRSSAAIRLFRSLCDADIADHLRKRIRKIRRATGEARQVDVCLNRLSQDMASAPPENLQAIALLVAALEKERARAQNEIEECVTPRLQESVAGLMRSLLRSIRSPVAIERRGSEGGRGAASAPYTLGELCAIELGSMVDAARFAEQRPLEDLNELHRFRIANKKVRYALEMVSGCFPDRLAQELQPIVDEWHDRLGEINDLHELGNRLEAAAGDKKLAAETESGRDGRGAAPPFLKNLAEQYRRKRDERHAEVMEWSMAPARLAVFDEIAEMAADLGLPRQAAWGARRLPAEQTGQRAKKPGLLKELSTGAIALHRRVAAIDVGTNSIRLTVAETDPVSRFRVIEDLKETTRLGAGVYTDGLLRPARITQSLTVLERMKSVAEKYHVDRIRAVGTSALREAANSDEFLAQARRVGVDIDVIDAKQEARLAYSSVATAFDLSHLRAAIVDLGGGSTELILGSGGVVDAVHPLPMGAIRLTETFADPNSREMIRFGPMREAVDRVLNETIRRRRFHPDLMIGTGGTFTNLARVSILRGTPADGGRFPFAVRGYEMPRTEVVKLLDWFRGMAPEERRNVSGLGSQRADIIVAGICIIERLMAFLGVDRLRIHDGGIRDGLLAEMIDDLHLQSEPPRPASVDLVRTARSFAERCGYDQPHAEHVRTLSMQIFDQLAAQAPDVSGTWARREGRELLEAAAVLHDVGTLIGRRRHQCHSYDMIVHADLPGFTRREIEIIANIARYHRRSGPKPGHFNFRKLGDDDQRLVGHLAGILRIADGLDQPRGRNVLGVRVLAEPRCVQIQAHAEQEPSVNLEYAQKKADVFERTFHTHVEFSWSPASTQTTAAGRTS